MTSVTFLFLIPHCCHPFSLLCSAFLLSSMFCDPLLVILRHPLTIPLPAIPLHPSLNPILLMVLLNPTIFTFAMIYVLETSNSTLYSMGVSTGSHIPFQAASEQTGNASFGSTFLLIWTLQFCSTTNSRTSTKTIDDT